jgi:hypothetical protein
MIARQLCLVIGTGAVAMLAVGCELDAQTSGAEGSFDRTLPVTGAVDLSVKTGSGHIQIRTGADGTVHVVGHIRAFGSVWNTLSATEQVTQLETNPPIEQHDNTVQIGDIQNFRLQQNVSLSYDLVVPANTRARLASGSGDQVVETIRGPVEAHTGSGSIHTGHITEYVSVSTGSGQIELGGADGGVDVTVGSGSIQANAVAGSVKARAGSGTVRIAQIAPGDVDASTGSGSITLTGAQGSVRLRTGSGALMVEGQPAHDWTLSTGSGRVILHVPRDAAFDVDARSGSGSIETTHPVELLGTISKHRIQGHVHGGGPRLAVSTGSGVIGID